MMKNHCDSCVRGEFHGWSVELKISYDPAVVSQKQIRSMLVISGSHVGMGAWRPERGGSFGTFKVK
jgi:hypothetical protein